MGIRQTPDNNMATALRVVCVLASVVAIHGFTPSTMFGSRVVSHRPFLSKDPTMAVLKPEQIPFASSLGKKKIPDKKAWANYGPKPEKGKAVGGTVQRVDICIVQDAAGKLYALGNKAPPTGQPLEFGKVNSKAGTIADPTFGTEFSLKTGNVVGKWLPGGIGFLLRNLFPEPQVVLTFPVRGKGNNVEVQININAAKQFAALLEGYPRRSRAGYRKLLLSAQYT